MDRQSVEISSDDDLMMMMIYYRFNYCRAFAPDPYRCVRNILVHSGSSLVSLRRGLPPFLWLTMCYNLSVVQIVLNVGPVVPL